MAIAIRAYQPEDVPALVEIWNEVVEQGIAFPQKAPLTNQIGAAFFAKQSCTAAAYDKSSCIRQRNRTDNHQLVKSKYIWCRFLRESALFTLVNYCIDLLQFHGKYDIM